MQLVLRQKFAIEVESDSVETSSRRKMLQQTKKKESKGHFKAYCITSSNELPKYCIMNGCYQKFIFCGQFFFALFVGLLYFNAEKNENGNKNSILL